MNNFLDKIFKIKDSETSIKKELYAGLTTFFTMSYLFMISPKLMETAGFPFLPSVTALILCVFTGCCLCAFMANKPFAIAPFLGETAFIAYTVTGSMGFKVNSALAAVFICGLFLFLMTLTNTRMYILDKIPENIKVSFCTGLGLFFVYIALNYTGILLFKEDSLIPEFGNLLDFKVIAGIFCTFLILILSAFKIKAGILIAVLTTTGLGLIFHDISLPEKLVSLPSNPLPVMFKPDFTGIFDVKFIPVLFVFFILVNVDTSGAITGLLYKIEEKHKTPEDVKKVMTADSLSVILAPLFGTATAGTYFDSLTGMAAGGKTGLTSFTVGVMFLIMLIFTPLINIIPPYAYSPALLYVGIIMTGIVSKINYKDPTEIIPAVITICTTVFTRNIGFGIMSAFITYPLIKLLTGKKSVLNPVLFILFALSVLFFIIYPY